MEQKKAKMPRSESRAGPFLGCLPGKTIKPGYLSRVPIVVGGFSRELKRKATNVGGQAQLETFIVPELNVDILLVCQKLVARKVLKGPA